MNTALLAPPRLISPPASSSAASPAAASADSHFSFLDLLDIVNPLQHLPIVGTLYRAITGDHIGKFEKVAGDTLYGGVWGAVASIADLAFEAVTGKNAGDTVLAMFTGSHDAKAPAAIADNKTVPGADTLAATPDIMALTSALTLKGIDNDTAQRALYAYRKSAALPALALAGN